MSSLNFIVARYGKQVNDTVPVLSTDHPAKCGRGGTGRGKRQKNMYWEASQESTVTVE